MHFYSAIDKAEYAEIFKRFYRGKDVNDVEGIGIGLYLTREIITKQGGYVVVSSEIEKGTTFSVFLSKIHVRTHDVKEM